MISALIIILFFYLNRGNDLGMSSNTDMSVTPVYELSLAGLFSTSKPIMIVEEVFKEESTTETANLKNEIENTESYILFDENLVNKVQAVYLTFVN